jgi:hypothetical protein
MFTLCLLCAPIAADNGKLKFVRNGVEPTVPLCEQFLRRQLDALNSGGSGAAGESGEQRSHVTITLIGIGTCTFLLRIGDGETVDECGTACTAAWTSFSSTPYSPCGLYSIYTSYAVPSVLPTGEAETKPLSSLAQALGGEPQCAFYGITVVAHSDLVFQNVSAPVSDMSIVCDAGAGELLCEHITCLRIL